MTSPVERADGDQVLGGAKAAVVDGTPLGLDQQSGSWSRSAAEGIAPG